MMLGKTRGVRLVALLAVLWSVAAAATDLCTVINGLTRRPLTTAVDGFSFDFVSDLSDWIATRSCDPSEATVGWLSLYKNRTNLAYATNGGVYSTDAKIMYTLNGSIVENVFQISVSISVKMTLNRNGASTPAEATLGFEARGITADLAGRFAPTWQGSLKTTGYSGFGVFDDDLFDGSYGFVIDDVSAGTMPTADAMKQAETIARLAADVNQRFHNFEAVPTAVKDDVTARMAFPATSIIAAVTSNDVHVNGTSGFVASAHGECSGNACGADALRTLKQLASADITSESLTLMDNSVYGSLRATVSIEDNKNVYIIGVRATIQAVFSTPSGYIGISLETVADSESALENNKYSLRLFKEDKRAAIAQIKSVEMDVHGRRYGYVNGKSSTVMTPVETDMFGYGRGGALVDDVVITSSVVSSFQSAVSNIASELKSEYPAVNDVFSSLFDATASADVVRKYFAQVAHPTSYGLWSYWAEQFNGFAVTRDSDDDKLILEINSHIHSQYKYESADPSVSAINSVLSSVNSKVKETCGSSCSSLTGVPVLTAESITSGKIDIAVSATLTIPTMSLSSDYEKSNAAMKQIRIIRREDSINGVEDYHLVFVARITAALANQTSTLNEVSVIFSSAFGKAAMTSGSLVSAVTGVEQPVGMGIDGQTFFNKNIDSSLLPTFASSLSSISGLIYNQENATLTSLSQLNDRSSSQTLSQLLSSAASKLPTSGSFSVMTYFDSVRSLIEKTLQDAGVIPFLSLYYSESDNTISVDLTYVSVRRIGFEAKGVSWAKNVPIARTELTLPLASRASFVFGKSNSLKLFNIQGYSKAQGFSLPVRESMRTGLAVVGFAETVVNVPAYSYLRVSFKGEMERGSTFTGLFVGNMTMIADEEASIDRLFSFSMNEDNRGGYSQQADPSATLAAFSDMFMFPSGIAQHQLSSSIAPFNKPIADIVDLRSVWTDNTAWLFSSEAFPYVFIQGATLPFSGFSETVNITVNSNYTYENCVFNIPDCSNIDQLLSSLNQAVASCGDLSTFIDVDYSVDENSQLSIVMVPKYAGSVYNFIVTAPEESKSLMRSQSWSASRVTPDHLSWNDLYNGVYLSFLDMNPNHVYAMPEFTMVSVDDANLVDSNRSRFYPSQIPSVFFNATVKYTTTTSGVLIDPDFESFDNNVSVDIDSDTTVVESEVYADISFGMALWCSLGDGELPFFTSFSAEEGNRYTDVKVPEAPNNMFTFVATAEKRLASAVTSTPALEVITNTIKLTPGKLLIDALLEDVPQQLSGLASSMIEVKRYVDDLYGQDVQASIIFKPYLYDSDTLYVPLEFSVEPTNLVAFGSSTSYSQVKAVTSCPLSKGYKLHINVQSAPSSKDKNDGDNSFGLGDTVDCSGSLGVAEITGCSAQMTVNYSFSVESAKPIALLGDLHNIIPDKERFSSWYKNKANLLTVLNVNNLKFGVDSNEMSDLSSESVILKKVVDAPFNELTEDSNSIYSVDISPEKPSGRALSSLMSTNRKSFCSGLKQSLDKVIGFASSDEMNQVLPFTSQRMSPIFKRLINEHLEDAMNAVCDITNDDVATLSGFCDELRLKFGYSICGNTTLSDQGLDIPLLIDPEMAYSPVAFQFDSKRFISNANFSTAYGTSGDLLLNSSISADFGLKLVFLERNSSSDDDAKEYYSEAVLDPSKTMFSSNAALKSSPRLRTLLGSTIVTFDSQALNLKVSIRGSISENSDVIGVDLDGSAHLDAHAENEDSSYYCHLTADVPVVEHYFYPPANSWEDTVSFDDTCLQGNFASGVSTSMSNMTLAHYFEQDPNNFFLQFKSDLLKAMFDYVLDFVTDKAIAYIGKNIKALTSKVFDSIVGPDVAARVGDQITDMVARIIKQGQYPNATVLEQTVLEVFTGILNKVFAPILKSPIATPQAGDTITWHVEFGNVTTKQLKSIDWSCGDHGLADLEVKSNNQLTMTWSIIFNVVWSKNDGIKIEWPNDPAMSAVIRLDGHSLDLSGSILFLNADLAGDLGLSGELQVNPGQKVVKFNVGAQLSAMGKLGLVAKIRQQTKGEKANALGALPYVTAGVQASWAFNWQSSNSTKPTTPKSFQFTQPQLCLGSIITEFMQQVSVQVQRVLKPVDEIFGPTGILQKPIPGISKILGDHTNVLSILEWTCKMFSGTCNIDTVRKLVNVLNEISADIGKINDFMNVLQQPDACMDFAFIYKTFNISWSKENPTPDDPTSSSNGIIPMTPTEKFYDSVPTYQRSALHSIITKWSPSSTSFIPYDCVNCTEANATVVNDDDKFGFKLEILENFPEKLITLLLGGNVPLFSVSFPSATLAFSVGWTIPVWSTPYVAVKIHAGAQVSFKPPKIALMSDGIIDTVKTGNPSHLFRNLAVSTLDAFATGTFEVDGGAEGGIHIIIAKVTVNFDITVKFIVEARVANFNGNNWATFDSIVMQIHTYGIKGALQMTLKLRGGFKLYLQGCIHFIFKKCWTIVSWSWDTTLWSLELKNTLIKSISDGNGNIDASSFNFNYPLSEPTNALSARATNIRTYIITNTGVMFMPPNIDPGNAALTRNLDSNVGVSFSYSMPCTDNYNIIIDGDMRRPSITMPSCDKANIKVEQMGYRTVDQYEISGSSIMPYGRKPITLGSRCASVSLEKPVYGTKYVLTGSPMCQLNLDTEYGSTVNLTGSSSLYKGPITITGGVSKITVALACDNINIDKTQIKCDLLVINIPASVNVLTVAAIEVEPDDPHPHPHPHPKPLPEPVKLCINEVPEQRNLQIIGTSPLVSVNVSGMKNMSGFVSIVGNTADDNYFHVDMDTPVNNDVVATAYPSHLSYDDADVKDTHIIRHANVNVRSYTMRAASGRKSTLRVVAPSDNESVTVKMIGVKDGVLLNELGGCDDDSKVYVSMNGEGTQTLVLGTDGKLEDLQCVIDVMTDGVKNADGSSVREVIVNASYDSRPLNWEFSDSMFTVSNSLDTSDIFHVTTNGLDHVTVFLSHMNANRITFNKADKDGTEYLLVFPDGSTASSGSNDYSVVQILETHSPVLMKGPVMNVILGDGAGSVTPLSQIGAVVVAPSGSNIIMNSEGANSAMQMAISDNCVYEQNSAVVPRPSDWFVKAVEELGITFKEGCNVLVPKASNSQSGGFSTTFDITAGPQADTLYAVNPAANVVANMGAGDDSVTWLSPDSTSRLFVQMGEGSDSLTVQSAGSVSVDLGEDLAQDTVNVVCKDASPSIVHSSVFPIGIDGTDARLEISHWDSADTLEITRFSLVPPKERAYAMIASDVEGVKIKYQQNDNTDYQVRICTNKSQLFFTTGDVGLDRANNASLDISLEAYDTECNITVDGAENTNGAVTIGVDSNANVVPSELTMTTGAAIFGDMNVGLSNVDHLGVAISPAFTERGTLTISGSPAKRGIFVNMPSWRTVVADDVKDLAIMSTYGNLAVNNLDIDGQGIIVSLGSRDSSTQLELGVSNAVKEVTMTSGCLENANARVLSDWMLSRAKDAGFELSAVQKCSAYVGGLRYLVFHSEALETVSMSGLGWNSVRSVYLPPSVENLVMETSNTESKSTLWAGATIVNNDIMISKKNNDAFHVTMYGSKGNVRVASPVFAPSAKFIVNCTNTSYHHVWNLASDRKNSTGSLLRSYYADINFTSNGKTCSGRINSGVFVSPDTAPSVHLVSGLGASILMETMGSKNATVVERYVNLSNSDGMNELRFRSFDRSFEEALFDWDSTVGGNVTVHLGDRSENSIVVNPEATKQHPLYLSASVHSALSFPSLGNNSISFEGVQAAHFNVATKSFDLLGGKSGADNVFCFSPCDMCSEDTWKEIRILGQPCSLEKQATSVCSGSARIHVSQGDSPVLLDVGCGKAKWDPTAAGDAECGISFNENGAEGELVNAIPTVCRVLAGVLVVCAGVATAIGASVLISRATVALGKTAVPGVNQWWLSNMMRDFFNDQFSWASIVLTACLGGVTNYDISNWGGPVDGLVLQTKALVFEWLNFCNSAYSPVVIAMWILAAAAVVMRVLTAYGSRQGTHGWRRSLLVLNPVHAVLSCVTLLLLPLAGYAVPVLMSVNVFCGIMTLLSALGIIASVPVGEFNAVTRVRVIASYIAVSVPFLVSIVAAVGAARGLMLAMLLVCAILLPLCNTFVLWKLYFAGADTRTKAWKHGLFWTFSLRAASLICGVIFISTLFFDLPATASGFSYAFWFLWVVLPVFQLIPLVIGTKSSNIAPRDFRTSSYYGPINAGETAPLRSSGAIPVASLNSIANISASDKDMMDVAAA